MCGVVCGIHQKDREKPRGFALLYFFQAFIVLTVDARMQEAVVPNFWNKHGLQMNETVVRFNLVNARRCTTFRGLQSICQNKANP